MLSEDYPVATDHAGKCLSLLADVQDTDSQALCLQLSGMVLILTGLDVEEGLAPRPWRLSYSALLATDSVLHGRW